jgi:hypothetical protein
LGGDLANRTAVFASGVVRCTGFVFFEDMRGGGRWLARLRWI